MTISIILFQHLTVVKSASTTVAANKIPLISMLQDFFYSFSNIVKKMRQGSNNENY